MDGKGAYAQCEKMGKTHLGEHDIGKKNRSEWCDAGSARCRLGPKMMNHSGPEKKDANEHGRMLKIILKSLKEERCWT